MKLLVEAPPGRNHRAGAAGRGAALAMSAGTLRAGDRVTVLATAPRTRGE